MTSCRPSRRASFPSLGDTTPALVFRPHAAERCRGRVSWSWSPGTSGRELVSGNGRISYVPGEPQLCSCPVLRPRRDRRIRPLQCAGAAPAVSTTKAPTFVLSRLNHTASALAVYASQAGSPRHHARLASGCWPSSSGRACLPAGFRRKVSSCILHLSLLSQVQRSARTPYIILDEETVSGTGFSMDSGASLCSALAIRLPRSVVFRRSGFPA